MSSIAWRVVGASVRGKRHEKTGQPCQDAHQWRLVPGNVLIAAVADGAGTASFADTSATLAVRTAMDHLAQQPSWPLASPDSIAWREILLAALKAAHAAVLSEVQKRDLPSREFATTLLLSIASPEWAAGAQIGDGAIVIKKYDGELLALTRPVLTEYLNETVFLTSAGAVEKAQIAIYSGKLSHLGLLSDGLQMLALKMPDGLPHAPFFNPLLRLTEGTVDCPTAQDQLSAFLHSSRVAARTDDDLTLLLAGNSISA